MDPREKKVKEEELNVEETLNNAEEQPQDEQAENAVPMTHEEDLQKETITLKQYRLLTLLTCHFRLKRYVRQIL